MKTGYKWVEPIRVLGLCLCAIVLGGCQALPANEEGLTVPSIWQSQLELEHPLVGVIWDVQKQQQIGITELELEIESARYLLLGEKHDNPDHHLLQLAVLSRLAEIKQLDRVSFEMLTENKQPLLDEIETVGLPTGDSIKQYLEWDEEGWDWNLYGPLVKLVADQGVPMAAGNISRETMLSVYGAANADAVEFLSNDVLQQLNQDIDDGHCGMLPESQFPAMVRVQRARDQKMAESVQVEANEKGVLIAGNYHIRHDLGVPNYLLQLDSNLSRADVVSLSFTEVNAALLSAADYVESTAGIAAADFIWFTPAVNSEDYCASLREEA